MADNALIIGGVISSCITLVIIGVIIFFVFNGSSGVSSSGWNGIAVGEPNGSGGGGWSGSGSGSGGSGSGGSGSGSGGSGGVASGAACANNWECIDSEKCDNGVCVIGDRACSTWNDCPGDLVCMSGFCGPDDGTGGSGGVEDTVDTSGSGSGSGGSSGGTNGGTTYAPVDGDVTSLFTGVTEKQANTILQLTSLFENSTPVLQFGYAENIGDGRGFTFGFVGFTSGTCDGSMILEEYERIKGPNNLSQYIAPMKSIDSSGGCFSGSTSGLEGFASAVAAAASDPLFIQAQLNTANQLYIGPSQAKINQLGFQYAITQGELYDAYINHGESGAVSMINQATSAVGTSDEKAWLKKFLEIRYGVLAADSTWASAVDRVHVYQTLLESGNVNLDTPINASVYGSNFNLV